MKDRVAIVTAVSAAVLHLAVANRYDLFRDELYSIVCGRHPAFGYADQPLRAVARYALGHATRVVRLPEILAIAAFARDVVASVRLLAISELQMVYLARL